MVSEGLADRVRARNLFQSDNRLRLDRSDNGRLDAGSLCAGNCRCRWLSPAGHHGRDHDENGRVLRAGDEGVVRVQSEYGVGEYLEDPEETQRVFRDGWFYPGDLGYVTKDNLLVISGRATSVVDSGGETSNPEAASKRSCRRTQMSCSVASWLFRANPAWTNFALSSCRTRTWMSKLFATIARRGCQPRLCPLRFVSVAQLPRNEMGKIERGKLADLLKTKMN